MSNSEVLKDTLSMLDKFEENRKADYSIWGYLYQFDLMLYDMLTDKSRDDLFNDYDKLYDKDCSITYEAEMVEDYCKEFILDNVLYIRLAQVKYNYRSKSVFYIQNKDALKTLYYMYLKAQVLDCEEFDFKCSLFYFNSHKNSNETDYTSEMKVELKSIVEEEIEAVNKMLNDRKKEIDRSSWVALTLDNENIYEILESKNLEGRIQYLFYNLSSDERINYFIDNILIVRKVQERQKLISEIKNIMERDYSNLLKDDCSLNQIRGKGDTLYSLGVNFIINNWQSKDDKSNRRPINLNDVTNYIKSINAKGISIEDIVDGLLVEFFEEILETIEDQIDEDDLKDLNKENMLRNFEGISCELLKYFRTLLKSKNNRYTVFNTIDRSKFRTMDEYLQLSPIEEYKIMNQMKDLFINFCRRTLKIMYWEIYVKNNEIKLTEWFKVDKGLLIFKKNNLKIKTILLPDAYEDGVISTCKNIVHRINQTESDYSKPRVWYFKNINSSKKYIDIKSYNMQKLEKPYGKKMQYELNIAKIPDPNITNNIAGHNEDYFYIECMDCLKMSEISNYEYIEHIFSERCVNCGLKKNR